MCYNISITIKELTMKKMTINDFLIQTRMSAFECAEYVEKNDMSYGIENFSLNALQYQEKPKNFDYAKAGQFLDEIRAEYKKIEENKKSVIFEEKNQEKVEMICDCGHIISRIEVMNTTSGTACQRCYNRMSS